MSETLTVGKLRQQCALLDGNTRVEIICAEGTDGRGLPCGLIQAVDCYPDTCDQRGKWQSTFKIIVGRQP